MDADLSPFKAESLTALSVRPIQHRTANRRAFFYILLSNPEVYPWLKNGPTILMTFSVTTPAPGLPYHDRTCMAVCHRGRVLAREFPRRGHPAADCAIPSPARICGLAGWSPNIPCRPSP